MPYLKVLSQYFYSNWGKRRIWASIAGNQAETAGEDDCFTLIMKNAFCLVKVTWRTCSGICSSTAHVITCGSHKRKTTASIYLQLATSPRRHRSQDLHGSAKSSTADKTRNMNRGGISSPTNLTTVISLPWSMGTIPVAAHTEACCFSNGSRLWTKQLVRTKHLKKRKLGGSLTIGQEKKTE